MPFPQPGYQQLMQADTQQRRSGGSDRVAAAVYFFDIEAPTGEEDAQSGHLPHLRDYNVHVRWRVFAKTFFFSALRQGICNYMTASGIAENKIVLDASIKAFASVGIILGAYWIAQMVMGERWRTQLTLFFAIFGAVFYGVVFAIKSTAAALTQLPCLLLAFLVGLPWSQRRCFAVVYVTLAACLQVMLTFITNALPRVQRRLPEAARQFLVPALKTFYLAVVCEVMTKVWIKMYKRPCPPVALTGWLLIALVSAETMGLVGLLAAVDSANPWSNAAIFCATTIVTETNSRSGICMSILFRLMGKKYRFSDAAHVFRWGKMWASYAWLCAFSGFVAPALVLGLKAEGSNFTFLRWEVWALTGIFLLQQIVTDFIYVNVQHYIRPSPLLSQTAARCLALGEATPVFGENEHVADGGRAQALPKGLEGEEDFEAASLKVGPWTITVEALLPFLLFEYTVNVWNNYVRGQFGSRGTFLPTRDGSCD